LKKPAKTKERSDAGRDRDRDRGRDGDGDRASMKRKGSAAVQGSMQRYRIEVGKDHGAKPGNIVGAIANEAGLNGKEIGQIDMHGEFSIVDLPKGMPDEVFNGLKATRVAGQKLNIAPVKDDEVPRQNKDARRSGEKTDKKPRRNPRKSKSS